MRKRRGLTKKERKNKKKKQITNRKLIKKYYWLAPRNVWTDKIPDDYDYTWIEWGWSKGWDKAFGKIYMEELGAAIKEAGLKDFRILQIKEKYGQARCYTSYGTDKIYNIINKYEVISEHICYYCGKEAPMVGRYWITPECFDCYKKRWKKKGLSEEELRKKYEDEICDVPDEKGEYHLPDTYTVTQLSKDANIETTYDISDTTSKIRKWWNKHH